MLAAALVVEMLMSSSHPMFIVGIHWMHLAITLALPLSLIGAGSVLIHRDRRKA